MSMQDLVVVVRGREKSRGLIQPRLSIWLGPLLLTARVINIDPLVGCRGNCLRCSCQEHNHGTEWTPLSVPVMMRVWVTILTPLLHWAPAATKLRWPQTP